MFPIYIIVKISTDSYKIMFVTNDPNTASDKFNQFKKESKKIPLHQKIQHLELLSISSETQNSMLDICFY